MTYLLDTNICIYVIKNQYVKLVEKLNRVGIENTAISTITVAELEFGVANSSKPQESLFNLYEFLTPFAILDFDMSAARHYGKIRKALKDIGQPIGTMDTLIAAIALSRDHVLVTNNEREFLRIADLKVENWVK